jgi:hypothetical protein
VLVSGNTAVVVAGEASPLAAVDLTGAPAGIDASVIGEAADNVKCLIRGSADDQSPYVITDFCEMKTVWHPVGR